MEWIAAQLAKWSLAQWTAGTAVIALLIAIYGAILSTLNFLRIGPKLRFNARVDRGILLQIDVANYGGRSTTLTKIIIRYFDNSAPAEPPHKDVAIRRPDATVPA
jgi:hypothetical protein